MGNQLTLVHREVKEALGLLGPLALLGGFTGGFLARGFLLCHEIYSPKCGGWGASASNGRHARDITMHIGTPLKILANFFFRARGPLRPSSSARGIAVASATAERALARRPAKTARAMLARTQTSIHCTARNSLTQRRLVRAQRVCREPAGRRQTQPIASAAQRLTRARLSRFNLALPCPGERGTVAQKKSVAGQATDPFDHRRRAALGPHRLLARGEADGLRPRVQPS